jgi:V/A-type H+-transporting ATPase subunit E
MKQLETGQDKIQKIANDLKQNVIAPAKQEAAQLVAKAREEAESILAEAEKKAAELLKQTKKEIEEEHRVFQSSLQQAVRQALETLRQAIETKLFSENLAAIIEKQSADPKVVANLIQAIISAVQKEGMETDLSALIPKTVSVQEVNALLGDQIIKKLKEGTVVTGEFAGGAQIRLNGKYILLDISDHPLKELLSNYVRKDFRKLLFQNQ